MSQSKHWLTLLEQHLAQQTWGTTPASLYEPIRYIMKLGGKRMRPMLVCTAYSLYKSDVERVIPLAAAVEAFHNFTLMHDDIMDQAPLRRGKATVHEKWNVNTAILSGDVMLVRVYDQLLHMPINQLTEVLPLFNRTAAEVCEGQQWDMEFETKARVTEAQYVEMIRLKTAVLLGFSLELGALLADAPEEDRQALYDFGINMGIGFQLKDDLLDVFADQKKFGKQAGGDIIANKKTYLLIKALALAKGKQKAELQKWLAAKKFDKRKKVKAVTALYEQLNIRELTQAKINQYFNKAFASLEKLSVNADALVIYAKEISARQK